MRLTVTSPPIYRSDVKCCVGVATSPYLTSQFESAYGRPSTSPRSTDRYSWYGGGQSGAATPWCGAGDRQPFPADQHRLHPSLDFAGSVSPSGEYKRVVANGYSLAAYSGTHDIRRHQITR